MMSEKLKARLQSYACVPYISPARIPVKHSKLGKQITGYLEAILATVRDDTFGGDNELFSRNYNITDFDEASLLQSIRDNLHFNHRVTSTGLNSVCEDWDYDDYCLGRDFWHSRMNWDTGFSGQGWDEEWFELHKISRGFGEVRYWVNERNKIALIWQWRKVLTTEEIKGRNE